ncbi:2-oxo acid dehydrogenase subunit E2 [uncultured Pseudoteredinibacter sp.]|uniref:dihydrolipoamide acetyltransferase family protein n=1 Tax=uncultured Pseudoteredinibacter sp. TaxID=1641701 RepID=UPI00263222B4|nr:2-oxo acid dehydrogenase subunit E2 [uncultured Pseudoteredinibacter sp.]
MMSVQELRLTAEQLEGTEATLSQWLFNIGDAVSEGEPVVELETDKVAIEVVAPCSGVLTEHKFKPGDKVEPDSVMALINTEAQQSVSQADKANKPEENVLTTNVVAQQSAVNPDQSCRHLMGPAVRKLVAEHNLDIEQMQGSGRGGRITREDALSYIASGQAQKTASNNAINSAVAMADMNSRMVPHSSMRKAIAKHMVESLLEKAPHVTSVFEMDMSNIIEHRKWHKKEFAEKGVNLTFTAYFLAASAKAMAAVPDMNAQFHEDALEIFQSINIGVGTALGDKGLVVPVVKNVQAMDLLGIAQALDDQTQRARENKLTPFDMKGGTFTISNHGVSGSLMAAPIIINQPQVAILGIGKMEKRVEVIEVDGRDEMRIRPKCYVSLSIDHRAVDAHQTNAWLSCFVNEIETWGGV